MMRRGLIDAAPLEPVAPMDHELWSRIADMDLSPVVTQLVTYLGWSAERAAAAEQRYRRFFYLKATLPEGNASPTTEIDEFWHQHILNTRRYASDSQRIYDRFIHHSRPREPSRRRSSNLA